MYCLSDTNPNEKKNCPTERSLALSLLRLFQIHYFIFIQFERCIHQYNAALIESKFNDINNTLCFCAPLLVRRAIQVMLNKNNSRFVPIWNWKHTGTWECMQKIKRVNSMDFWVIDLHEDCQEKRSTKCLAPHVSADYFQRPRDRLIKSTSNSSGCGLARLYSNICSMRVSSCAIFNIQVAYSPLCVLKCWCLWRLLLLVHFVQCEWFTLASSASD